MTLVCGASHCLLRSASSPSTLSLLYTLRLSPPVPAFGRTACSIQYLGTVFRSVIRPADCTTLSSRPFGTVAACLRPESALLSPN
ncbi:hypothetical protein LY78DRAFT_58346 [Colletotrichum sublineola]|nr:hypothetical protein LY78DRAFT_58346 [Colletotrichum sublineola]